MTTLTPEQLAELREVAEAAYKAWQEGDKVFKHPETFSDTSRRAFMAGRASLFAALAEAQAERDRLAAQVEALTAQLGAMQECATMFVEGHGMLDNADLHDDWDNGWEIIAKAKLAAPELLHPRVGTDIIALKRLVGALREAIRDHLNRPDYWDGLRKALDDAARAAQEGE